MIFKPKILGHFVIETVNVQIFLTRMRFHNLPFESHRHKKTYHCWTMGNTDLNRRFYSRLSKKILTCSNSYESWLVQNPDWNLWVCHAYPLFKYALLCLGYPPSSFVLSQHTLHLTDTHQLFLLSCLFVTWTAVYFCERTLPSNEYGGVKDDESHDNFPCSNHSLYPASFCSI